MLLILFVLGVYFLPFLTALARGHHQTGAIFVLNLFLGATCIGWIIALVWACTAKMQRLAVAPAIAAPHLQPDRSVTPSNWWLPGLIVAATLCVLVGAQAFHRNEVKLNLAETPAPASWTPVIEGARD